MSGDHARRPERGPGTLNEALEHHRRGRLDRAAQGYAAALAEDPANPEALHLLGLMSLQRGDPRRAAAMIGRAVAVRPDEATYHADLAEAYWALGDLERVLACCRTALRLEPDSPRVHCNLGSTLMARGAVDAALGHFQEAVRLDPGFAAARNNLGNALRLKGEPIAALEQFRAAVRLDPVSAEARNNLGALLLKLGRPEEALEHGQEAVRLRPDSAMARVKLGNILYVLGRLEEAADCFRAAIRLQPDLAAAHANLGGVLEELGDLEQAAASLRAALRHDPRHAGALARLATRQRGQLPEADLATIEDLLAGPGLPPEQRGPLLFGLAQAVDARGQFDRAAELTRQANALQRAQLQQRRLDYDPEAHRRFVDRLLAAFSPEFFTRLRGAGLETERPVFVVGMPRSGTTLVEQVLASHPRVFAASELPLVRQTFAAVPTATGPNPSGSPLDGIPHLNRQAVLHLARRHLDAL